MYEGMTFAFGFRNSRQKRLDKYAIGQHSLICKELNVSDSPDEPGDTAFEAVCRLLAKIEKLENK